MNRSHPDRTPFLFRWANNTALFEWDAAYAVSEIVSTGSSASDGNAVTLLSLFFADILKGIFAPANASPEDMLKTRRGTPPCARRKAR